MRSSSWIETYGSVAAILFAFFIGWATLRLARPAAASAPRAEARAIAPPASCAAEIGARLGPRIDLVDAFAESPLPRPGAAARRLRVRLDRACDFEPGSDALTYPAEGVLADLGATLASRGAIATISVGEALGEPGLASRRALAAAARLEAAGVAASRIEVRAATRAAGPGAIEILIAEAAK